MDETYFTGYIKVAEGMPDLAPAEVEADTKGENAVDCTAEGASLLDERTASMILSSVALTREVDKIYEMFENGPDVCGRWRSSHFR